MVEQIEQVVNSQAVSQLRTLLEDAEEGRITEFVMCYKYKNHGGYSHCWTGSNDIYKFIGALEVMKQRAMFRLRPLLSQIAEADCWDELYL